jgi:hypothetical protein
MEVLKHNHPARGKDMKAKGILLCVVILCGVLVLSGCATYKITRKLEKPINREGNCSIGDIKDQLPIDFDEEDKPTLEEVDKLRDHLRIELEKKGIFRAVEMLNPDAEYEVTGGILDYKKGSGAVRFLIGFGAGNAKLTVNLRLEDRNTEEVLFAGNFFREVSDWTESGAKTYERVGKDFAKALEKEIKKLKEGKE